MIDHLQPGSCATKGTGRYCATSVAWLVFRTEFLVNTPRAIGGCSAFWLLSVDDLSLLRILKDACWHVQC